MRFLRSCVWNLKYYSETHKILMDLRVSSLDIRTNIPSISMLFVCFFKSSLHASMYGLFWAQVQLICTSFFIFLIIIWTLNYKDTLFFHAIALNFKCILVFQANICYYYFWTIVIPTFGCVYFQSKFANYYL